VRSSLVVVALVIVASASAAFGCGAPEKEGRYPKRPEGCDVKVFPESPTMPTDNIGTVDAICGDDISNDACLQTLKDQVCKLGGDVAWGVSDVPSVSLGKKKLSGRAAHTKTAGPTK
jgi:hypothetical protein